ncbi:MAG: hypothetical protein GYB36_12925 [Alphaproteobacteria bacterium]|nr:hypothetical protein [Alphaproteobacteria bacterium]
MTTHLNRSFAKAAPKREVAGQFCIRLTPSEKALLKERAGNLTVSEYVRRRTLGDEAKPRRKSRRPSRDDKTLAKLLGTLGQSRLASNMNQIAKAANLGALPVTDELIAELTQACFDIRTMRRELITALGLKVEG